MRRLACGTPRTVRLAAAGPSRARCREQWTLPHRLHCGEQWPAALLRRFCTQCTVHSHSVHRAHASRRAGAAVWTPDRGSPRSGQSRSPCCESEQLSWRGRRASGPVTSFPSAQSLCQAFRDARRPVMLFLGRCASLHLPHSTPADQLCYVEQHPVHDDVISDEP